MKLHMFLHDELAATFNTGPGQLATLEDIHWTGAGARVSAAWDQVPTPESLTHWLEACLPENGSRAPYEERARARKLDHGESPLIGGPVDILWGNTDAEYPGAVRFRRDDEVEPEETDHGYVRLADHDIGERLHEAWRIATQAGKGAERAWGERRSSLSGMRGKIGLTKAEDGAWYAAQGCALNTWIAKREDDPKLPGEAGIESICQRTLALIGIAAARTLSRVFAGEQCVTRTAISQRSTGEWKGCSSTSKSAAKRGRRPLTACGQQARGDTRRAGDALMAAALTRFGTGVQQSAGRLRPFVRRRASVARASNSDGVSHSSNAASTPSNAS